MPIYIQQVCRTRRILSQFFEPANPLIVVQLFQFGNVDRRILRPWNCERAGREDKLFLNEDEYQKRDCSNYFNSYPIFFKTD